MPQKRECIRGTDGAGIWPPYKYAAGVAYQ